MQRYFEFIVRRRWLVLIVSLGIAAAGFYNLLNLAIDAVPDISPKQVMILTEVSGMAAPEVERLATFPVENAMAGIPGLKSIRSISRFGISAVYVTFHDTVEETTARQYVFQRLQQAKQMMAPGVGEPNMGPMATGLGENLSVPTARTGLYAHAALANDAVDDCSAAKADARDRGCEHLWRRDADL